MDQEETKKTSGRIEGGEARKTSNRMEKPEKTVSQKVAEIAEELASTPRKKDSPKAAMLKAVKEQKTQFLKALKNGHTKKEILEKLKEQGFVISARDLASVLGTKKSKNGA